MLLCHFETANFGQLIQTTILKHPPIADMYMRET